jgi:hypothetical protein
MFLKGILEKQNYNYKDIVSTHGPWIIYSVLLVQNYYGLIAIVLLFTQIPKG